MKFSILYQKQVIHFSIWYTHLQDSNSNLAQSHLFFGGGIYQSKHVCWPSTNFWSSTSGWDPFPRDVSESGWFTKQIGVEALCFQMERTGPGWKWQVLPMELCVYGDWGSYRNYEPLLCVLTWNFQSALDTWKSYSHFSGYFLLISSIVEACRILRRCSTRAGSRWIPVDGKFHLPTWSEVNQPFLQGVVIGRGVMNHKS